MEFYQFINEHNISTAIVGIVGIVIIGFNIGFLIVRKLNIQDKSDRFDKAIKNFVNTIPGCFCYTALTGWCFFGIENSSFWFGIFFFWGLLNLLVLCLDYIKNKG